MHAGHGWTNAGSCETWKMKAQQFDWDPAQTSLAVTAEQTSQFSSFSVRHIETPRRPFSLMTRQKSSQR